MPVIKTNILLTLGAVILLISGVYIYFLYVYMHLPPGLSATLSISYASLTALVIWGLLLIINAYPTRVGIVVYALALATGAALTIHSVDAVILRYLQRTQEDLLKPVISTGIIRFIITWIICGWVATYTAIQKKLRELKTKFVQQADASDLLREAELFKLRQQLQPHFLYNSLNSISALTMIEPEKAQDMIGKLSDFLRSSVKRESQDLITIQEELEYIEAYLSIESIRFGDRLKVLFEKEYTDDAMIPPFLLQPLLENAIKFGLYGKTGAVAVMVHIVLEAPYLVITISNPYDNDSQVPRGTGFGLRGIERRLYLVYARTDLLETRKENNIFTTILKIPQDHV